MLDGNIFKMYILRIAHRVLETELPDKRREGRPQRRFTGAVKEDIDVVGVKA